MVPDAITECKSVYTDLKHLLAAIKSMSSPIKFVYHVAKDILVNGV